MVHPVTDDELVRAVPCGVAAAAEERGRVGRASGHPMDQEERGELVPHQRPFALRRTRVNLSLVSLYAARIFLVAEP